MKFDTALWGDAPMNCETQGPEGRLKLVASAFCSLFVDQGFGSVCVGHGAKFDIRLHGPYTYKLVGPKDTQAVVRWFGTAAVESTGVIHTSPDVSGSNGTVLELKRLLREQKLSLRAEKLAGREALIAAKLARMDKEAAASAEAKRIADEKAADAVRDQEAEKMAVAIGKALAKGGANE